MSNELETSAGSTLTLFVLRVLTNDHDLAMSFDDLALFANFFDGRLNFHFDNLTFRKLLLLSPGDTPLRDIVRRYRDGDRVSHENSDIVHAKLTGYGSGHDVTVRQLDFEHRVRQYFDYHAVFKFNQIVLWQNNPSLFIG